MIALLGTLFLAAAQAADPASCAQVSETPETFLVAWISPMGEHTSRRETMEVVRVADLRRWIREEGADQGRLLQALGLVKKADSARAAMRHKISFFDVHRDWLCRPIVGELPGTDVLGITTCGEPDQKPKQWLRPKGFSGCGYTVDRATGGQGFDVMRIPWESAQSRGFCMMPLGRFLDGA